MKKQLGLVALVIAGVGLIASACLINKAETKIDLNRNYDPTTNITLQNDSDYLGLWTFNEGYLIYENTFQVEGIVYFRQGYENFKYNQFILSFNGDNDQYEIYYSKTTEEWADLAYTTYDNTYWTNNTFKTIVIESMGDNPSGIVDFKRFLNNNATHDSGEPTTSESTAPTSEPTSQPTTTPSSYVPPLNNLSGTIWRFNNAINLTTAEYLVTYESNNIPFGELHLTTTQLIYYQDGGDPENTIAYDTLTGWANWNYQTIVFDTGNIGADQQNQTLITWLFNNATWLNDPNANTSTSNPTSTPTSQPLYNLANTVWQFNNNLIDPQTTLQYNVNFVSYSTKYSALIIRPIDQETLHGFELVYYRKVNGNAVERTVYSYVENLSTQEVTEQWYAQDYKIITLVNGNDITNPYLIQFMLQNATQYNYTPPTPTTSGTSSSTSAVTTEIVINQEIVPIADVMWEVISMPFTFISTGFNLVLFPGTPYQVNVGLLFFGLLGLVAVLFVVKIIIKIFK